MGSHSHVYAISTIYSRSFGTISAMIFRFAVREVLRIPDLWQRRDIFGVCRERGKRRKKFEFREENRCSLRARARPRFLATCPATIREIARVTGTRLPRGEKILGHRKKQWGARSCGEEGARGKGGQSFASGKERVCRGGADPVNREFQRERKSWETGYEGAGEGRGG